MVGSPQRYQGMAFALALTVAPVLALAVLPPTSVVPIVVAVIRRRCGLGLLDGRRFHPLDDLGRARRERGRQQKLWEEPDHGFRARTDHAAAFFRGNGGAAACLERPAMTNQGCGRLPHAT